MMLYGNLSRYDTATLEQFLNTRAPAGAGGNSIRQQQRVARGIIANRAKGTGQANDMLAIKKSMGDLVAQARAGADQFLASVPRTKAAGKNLIEPLTRLAILGFAATLPGASLSMKTTKQEAKAAFSRAFSDPVIKQAYFEGKGAGFWALDYNNVIDDLIGVATVIGTALTFDAAGQALAAMQAGTGQAAGIAGQETVKSAAGKAVGKLALKNAPSAVVQSSAPVVAEATAPTLAETATQTIGAVSGGAKTLAAGASAIAAGKAAIASLVPAKKSPPVQMPQGGATVQKPKSNGLLWVAAAVASYFVLGV